MPQKFSLLIHGHDGNIPYLTPELIRQMFQRSKEDKTEDCDQTTGGSHVPLEEFLILGVALKDTCVTPVYRHDDATTSYAKKKGGLKRKRGQFDVEEKNGKLLTTNSKGNAADYSAFDKSNGCEVPKEIIETNGEENGSTGTSKQGEEINKSSGNEQHAKKPAGYTFFTPASSVKICDDIRSHSGENHADEERGETNETNLMQTYLRIAPRISTLIAPTFSFIGSCNADNCGRSDVGAKNEAKGYKPKHQDDNIQAKKKQKQQQKPTNKNKSTCIPKSTRENVSIQTPHGWQVITAGQYVDACNSLVVLASSTSNDKKMTTNEGAVGLFDHVDITLSQINALFQKHGLSTDSDVSAEKAGCQEDSNNSLMVKQAFKKIGMSVQKTNGWTDHIQSSSTPLSPSFWTPINIFAPQIPRFQVQDEISNSSRVAIVGWDSIPSTREYRSRRRLYLREAIERIQLSSPKHLHERKFLLLAVNDIQAILDAAREGVSIIGTNIAVSWSRSGRALVLKFDTNNTKDNPRSHFKDGIIHLNDEQYARDSLPILPGCKCLACRPRSKHHSQRSEGYHHFLRCKIDDSETPPSFSRAYIHHLIRAKEMLAQTLLFAHNLHQLLVLFQRLSSTTLGDDKNGFEQDRSEGITELETLCNFIEGQLQATDSSE
ncbi:hypothetical protein ACHAXS_009650 [Conticribra weissflogii]